MKELIESHLSVVDESPAKNIAKAIGMPDLEVSRELNRMIADGVVERAKRAGGGNEYMYWLTRKAPEKSLAVATALDTDPDFHPVDLPPTDVAPWSAGIDDVVDAEFMPSPDVEPLMAAGDLAPLLNILGHAAPSPTTVADCIEAARTVMARLERLRANNADLERRIDDLTNACPALPPLYVTMGSTAPARRHTALDSAQRRAKALIKSGKEDSVLVLVPHGKMKRGAEWSAL
ncbi:1-pyrroline-5-carboxylate dehydrogenase [Robbsia sp. KACC 23696]|uniref:1-pyrroline-5-carboxylate dehydrogenase n=1 Tax=Robbsia sp. KACC 23696 TaxID=3149231 RepID=UPI00325B7BC8